MPSCKSCLQIFVLGSVFTFYLYYYCQHSSCKLGYFFVTMFLLIFVLFCCLLCVFYVLIFGFWTNNTVYFNTFWNCRFSQTNFNFLVEKSLRKFLIVVMNIFIITVIIRIITVFLKLKLYKFEYIYDLLQYRLVFN